MSQGIVNLLMIMEQQVCWEIFLKKNVPILIESRNMDELRVQMGFFVSQLYSRHNLFCRSHTGTTKIVKFSQWNLCVLRQIFSSIFY